MLIYNKKQVICQPSLKTEEMTRGIIIDKAKNHTPIIYQKYGAFRLTNVSFD